MRTDDEDARARARSPSIFIRLRSDLRTCARKLLRKNDCETRARARAVFCRRSCAHAHGSEQEMDCILGAHLETDGRTTFFLLLHQPCFCIHSPGILLSRVCVCCLLSFAQRSTSVSNQYNTTLHCATLGKFA